MKSKRRQGSASLLKIARAVALQLRLNTEGTSLRIRLPKDTYETDTVGWCAVIGSLGKGQPGLEIWLDSYSGHPDRKLYACFYSRESKTIQTLSDSVSDHLWPVRHLNDSDMVVGTKAYVLKEKIREDEFNAPVLESYDRKRHHFFGFYDRTRQTKSEIGPGFCERAVAFFLDVARSIPGAKEEESPREIFPRCENRKWVKSHLRRERSGFLADQCKERDGYSCKVCKMTFARDYGNELGADFAEAHHLRPLGTLSDRVKTKLDDLVTVCANCHRMLHRMTGKPDDVQKLRATYLKHRKTRR